MNCFLSMFDHFAKLALKGLSQMFPEVIFNFVVNVERQVLLEMNILHVNWISISLGRRKWNSEID